MIYLVRHGETEFNRERRWQGIKDSPLTELGVRQARAMAGLLADLTVRDPGPWRIVASPLGRTRQTAAIVSERLGLPIAFDERLREHSIGEFDGERADDVVPQLRQDLPRHERHFHVPGGETYEALCQRIGGFLAEVRREDRLIIVSHGAAGRVFRGLYGGLGKEEMLTLPVPQDAVYRLMNGQVDRFDCEPLDEA
ncbi:histidine phosphatase family protein [Phenylobacterium sp.]|uniref:histidine phosphatase family protein n=1 Tax=Phenylobacterium sp. TaxID=1871053 RepID=UPI002DE21F1B|nr:histidine phosphatase family protein [Phenylobacterium sp.]